MWKPEHPIAWKYRLASDKPKIGVSNSMNAHIAEQPDPATAGSEAKIAGSAVSWATIRCSAYFEIFDSADSLARRHIPNDCRMVMTRGREAPAIRAERQMIHAAAMSRERQQKFR